MTLASRLSAASVCAAIFVTCVCRQRSKHQWFLAGSSLYLRANVWQPCAFSYLVLDLRAAAALGLASGV